MDNDCFLHQKKMLKFFGLSTNTNLFYRIYTISLLIVLTVYPFTVIPEIAKLKNKFDDLIVNVMFEIGYFMALMTTLCGYWHKFTLHKLFDNMQDLSHYAKSVINKKDHVLIQKYENVAIKQGYFGTTVAIGAITVSTLLAAILSIKREELILPFRSGSCFLENGAAKFVFQIFAFSAVGTVLYVELFIYIGMLILLSTHYQFLQYFIISITKTAQSRENVEEEIQSNNYQPAKITWNIFKIKLQKAVDYHTSLNERCKEMEATFNFFVLIVFSGLSLTLCCLLFYGSTLQPGNAYFIEELLFIVTCYTLLLIMSYWGDQVVTESGKISSASYEVDFVGLDVRIQKSLLLIQMQKPVQLTIGKIKILYLPTMVGVFQSIYSYYAFLTNIKDMY